MGQGAAPAYTIAEDVNILWLDIWAALAVSDGNGGVTLINSEEEMLGPRRARGNSGWMVRMTRRGSTTAARTA